MRASTPLLMVFFSAAALPTAWAEDTCTDFKWDVSKERALYKTAPTPLKAGTDAKTAPTVTPDTLYQIQLAAQKSVTFVIEPGRQSRSESDHAGVAVLKLPTSGAYRIALDMPLWIDVVANATLVPAKDFQGQHDCSAPHKIVEFDLVNDQTLTLQLSSSVADSVRVSVTASPARKL